MTPRNWCSPYVLCCDDRDGTRLYALLAFDSCAGNREISTYEWSTYVSGLSIVTCLIVIIYKILRRNAKGRIVWSILGETNAQQKDTMG